MKHYFFAHAGEDHQSIVESTQHAVDTSSIYVIPIIVTIMIVIPLILKSKMPRSNTPYIVLLAELFLAGVLTFSIAPVLSILSLSVGFMLAFFFVLLGLSKGE